jgi:hypothetical protein
MVKSAVPLHHVHDFKLTSQTKHDNPFRVRLTATFTDKAGRQIRNLPGFYDGGKTWKIRFCPTTMGEWTGRTRSDDPAMDDIELPAVVCVPNRNPNVRGLVSLDPHHRHRLMWADGTPYVPLGFELDWLAAFHQRLGQPKGKPVDPKKDRFTPALDLLVKRGFNYLVSNVYAYSRFSDPSEPYAYTPPDLYPFGGANEAPDHSVLNVKFFQDFDQAIAAAHRRGIVVDLMIQVQNKAVKWPARFSADDDAYWRYVLARYQAYGNIIWDVSKESFNLARAAPAQGYVFNRIEMIRRHDAYGHIVTAHDPEIHSQGRNSPVDDVCDLVSDQIHLYTGYSDAEVVEAARTYNREAIRRFRLADKPYVNIEFGYERGVEPIKTIDNNGCRPGKDLLIWSYALYAGGAYANYYYNNTSWNLVKFSPEPKSWKQFRYLRDWLDMMDLAPMAPDNEFARHGMCLAEPGRQYYVFLPEGGDEVLDLACAHGARKIAATWMDIYTGKRVQAKVSQPQFATPLANPLSDTSSPCALYVRVEH